MDPKQRSKADEGVSLMKEPSCRTQTSDAAADACTPTGLPGKDSDNYLDLFHLFFFFGCARSMEVPRPGIEICFVLKDAHAYP